MGSGKVAGAYCEAGSGNFGSGSFGGSLATEDGSGAGGRLSSSGSVSPGPGKGGPGKRSAGSLRSAMAKLKKAARACRRPPPRCSLKRFCLVRLMFCEIEPRPGKRFQGKNGRSSFELSPGSFRGIASMQFITVGRFVVNKSQQLIHSFHEWIRISVAA
jgi:hypothetical protein